jgi:Ca2+-binding EF-hand superfamily protein
MSSRLDSSRKDIRRIGKGNGGHGWSFKEMEKLIQEKVHSKCKKSGNEYQEAFKLFGRPQEGFNCKTFHRVLNTLGIPISSKDSRWLFRQYDDNGNGVIDFQEFMMFASPPGYSSNPWNFKRDQQIEMNASKTRAARVRNARPEQVQRQFETSYPKSLEKWRWDVDTIEKMVREKINSRTSRANVQAQDAFKLFGRPSGGIPMEMFQRQMAKLGLDLRISEVTALYNRWDSNRSGVIDFHEFIQGVMPPDYSSKTWNVRACERIDRQKFQHSQKLESTLRRRAAGKTEKKDPHHFPESLKRTRWSLDQIETLVREKVIARCRKANVEQQDAFKLFDRPSLGITPSVFKAVMKNKLNVHLHNDEVKALFRKWDDDHSGMITFKEFIDHVMKPDYTKQTWIERRDQECTQQQQEIVKRNRDQQDYMHRRSREGIADAMTVKTHRSSGLLKQRQVNDWVADYGFVKHSHQNTNSLAAIRSLERPSSSSVSMPALALRPRLATSALISRRHQVS